MNRNDFWWLLFFGGVLLVAQIWPKGGVNAAPKYGDREMTEFRHRQAGRSHRRDGIRH